MSTCMKWLLVLCVPLGRCLAKRQGEGKGWWENRCMQMPEAETVLSSFRKAGAEVDRTVAYLKTLVTRFLSVRGRKLYSLRLCAPPFQGFVLFL